MLGVLLIALAAAAPAQALPGFPGVVQLPPDVQLYDAGSVVHEDLAEVEFFQTGGRRVVQRGQHWRSYLRWPEATYKPVASYWPDWRARLTGSGWTVVGDDGATTYTLRRMAGGSEFWLSVAMGDYDSPLLELIEVRSSVLALTLQPPAATPERLADDRDFPYLAAPPGATFSGTGRFDDPLDVTVSGVDDEAQLVGNGYIVKHYMPPASLSRLQFELLYREALARAGWVVKPPPAGHRADEGRVVAQYRANGRNLWVEALRAADNGSTGLGFKVADLGAEDWAATLRQHCRLALYGLHFDFNRATLRADSAPVIDRLQGLLKADASLALEVQGHTDNVGGATYNQTLSEARASAVVEALVARGVAPARLSARGYGLRVPVESNATDAGRARNRRVEIVVPGCTP